MMKLPFLSLYFLYNQSLAGHNSCQNFYYSTELTTQKSISFLLNLILTTFIFSHRTIVSVKLLFHPAPKLISYESHASDNNN